VSDTTRITGVIDVIESFRIHDPQMQAQTMLAFLYSALLINKGESVCIKDIGRLMDCSASSASRNVKMHTKVNRHREKGTGLLDTKSNPNRESEKLISLTSKGRRTIENITETFYRE
jgi:DNA-binding MarR family transcriptional regulator|tara:strand:- start:135 stop:485 length:351 start_codon:yes stop_codon:yes gene_type:complete